MKMSPKLRRWLIIGGASVVGLLLVCMVTYLVLGRSGLHLGGAATQAPAAGDFYGFTSDTDKAAASRQALAGEAPPMPAPAQESGGMGGGPAAADGTVDNLAGMPTQAAQSIANNQDQQAQQHLIIRNGTVNIAVENTYSSEKSIEAMVSQMSADGAFVVSTNESPTGYGESPYITMVIRVPAAHFDDVMDTIAKLAAKGTTPTLTKAADDVTNQYVDVSARLTALEAARDRLQQIMSEAQNTNDLLQAEQQLTQREAEIDSLKGQKQFLEQSAALSSVTVTLTPYVLSQPVDSSWRPLESVRDAFDGLLGSLRGFGDFLIHFVIEVIPWLLILALVVYGVYRFVRGRIQRARARNANSGGGEA